MAVRWFWDFGIGLSESFYRESSWVLTSSGVETDDTVNVQSPSGSSSPDDLAVCRLTSNGASIETPALTPFAQGWAVFRMTWLSGNWFSGTSIFRIKSGTATLIDIRAANSGFSGVQVRLYIGNTLHGTSTLALDPNDPHVFAIRFDLTSVGHQAGLWIDGVEQVAFGTSGTAAAATADRLQWARGSSDQRTFNSPYLLDDLNDPLGTAVNVWTTTLKPNAVASDTEWSAFGGAADIVTGLGDSDGGTGAETSTDPSDLEIQFQDRNDVLAGWAPSNIYAVQGVALSSADAITDGSFVLADGAGSIATASQVFTSSPDFMTGLALLDNGGAPLVGADLDALTLTYTAT